MDRLSKDSVSKSVYFWFFIIFFCHYLASDISFALDAIIIEYSWFKTGQKLYSKPIFTNIVIQSMKIDLDVYLTQSCFAYFEKKEEFVPEIDMDTSIVTMLFCKITNSFLNFFFNGKNSFQFVFWKLHKWRV